MNNPHTPAPTRSRPAIEVDVVMRREPVSGPMSRWQPFRWVLADVLLRGSPDETGPEGEEHDHEPQAVVPVQAITGEADATEHEQSVGRPNAQILRHSEAVVAGAVSGFDRDEVVQGSSLDEGADAGGEGRIGETGYGGGGCSGVRQ